MSDPVTRLPSEVACLFDGQNAIVFDAKCVLCAGFFHFVMKWDTSESFAFATAQSPLGQTCYAALDLPLDDFETNLVVVDGQVFTKMDAFAVVMKALGFPWRILSVALILPGFIKTPMYHMIARNRYRLFGQYDTCMIPDPAVRARFLPQGWS